MISIVLCWLLESAVQATLTLASNKMELWIVDHLCTYIYKFFWNCTIILILYSWEGGLIKIQTHIFDTFLIGFYDIITCAIPIRNSSHCCKWQKVVYVIGPIGRPLHPKLSSFINLLMTDLHLHTEQHILLSSMTDSKTYIWEKKRQK